MAPADTVVRGVFYAFNMLGQILLLLSLVTSAVARLGRDMLLINIGIAMVIFSTACLLLLYADAYKGPEPPFSLCLAQACLIYGSLPMGACSIFGLFFQLASGMRGGGVGTAYKHTKALRISFRVLPWFIFYGVVIGCIIDGLRDRRDVRRSRDFFYCSASPRMGYACEIICAFFMIVSVVAEGYVLYVLFRGWRLRTLRRDLLPMDSLVRLGLFSCYGILTIVTCLVLLQFPNGTSPKYPFIFMSTLPLAVWMIFWTQKDILRIWICRRGVITHANVYDSETQRLQYNPANLTLRSMRADVGKS